MSPAQLEATADLDVHNAAREEGGVKPVEPEVLGHHHMSLGGNLLLSTWQTNTDILGCADELQTVCLKTLL